MREKLRRPQPAVVRYWLWSLLLLTARLTYSLCLSCHILCPTCYQYYILLKLLDCPLCGHPAPDSDRVHSQQTPHLQVPHHNLLFFSFRPLLSISSLIRSHICSPYHNMHPFCRDVKPENFLIGRSVDSHLTSFHLSFTCLSSGPAWRRTRWCSLWTSVLPRSTSTQTPTNTSLTGEQN